jgi:hypothetical protein
MIMKTLVEVQLNNWLRILLTDKYMGLIQLSNLLVSKNLTSTSTMKLHRISHSQLVGFIPLFVVKVQNMLLWNILNIIVS